MAHTKEDLLKKVTNEATATELEAMLRAHCLAYLADGNTKLNFKPEVVGAINKCWSPARQFLSGSANQPYLSADGKLDLHAICTANGFDFAGIQSKIDQAVNAVAIYGQCKEMTDKLVLTAVSIVSAPVAGSITGMTSQLIMQARNQLVRAWRCCDWASSKGTTK